MKKLVFINFAVLGLAGLSSEVLSMSPNSVDEQRSSQSNPSSIPVTQEEFRENIRREEGHKDDIRNLMEMFTSRIDDLTSELSGLRQQVRDQNDKISNLTNQNNVLQAQNDSLNQRLTNVLNSIEQKKLDEMQKANDLAEKQLAQQKAEAAAIAKREKERIARNNQKMEQLKKLEKDKDDWSKYIDGRNKGPVPDYSVSGHLFNEVAVNSYIKRKEKAPAEIKKIEQKMANIRASFE